MTIDRQIKVLIVDDHPLMRSGIAGEINAQQRHENRCRGRRRPIRN
jgi:DNA-binding NarL/FixJ family response regulator